MILSRAKTRFGLVAAAAALVMGFGLMTAGSAQAQVLPAVLYGTGLTAGATVEASIGGASCGSTTVNAAGEWALQIEVDAACEPSDGDAISFTVDGAPATSSPAAVWESGGTPSDVANGYTLTVGQATATPTATATATATQTATATTTATATMTVTASPAPPKTGNAGILGDDGGSGGLWLLLGLGAVAAAAVVGQRLYGGRRS